MQACLSADVIMCQTPTITPPGERVVRTRVPSIKINESKHGWRLTRQVTLWVSSNKHYGEAYALVESIYPVHAAASPDQTAAELCYCIQPWRCLVRSAITRARGSIGGIGCLGYNLHATHPSFFSVFSAPADTGAMYPRRRRSGLAKRAASRHWQRWMAIVLRTEHK